MSKFLAIHNFVTFQVPLNKKLFGRPMMKWWRNLWRNLWCNCYEDCFKMFTLRWQSFAGTFFCDFDLKHILWVLIFAICMRKWYTHSSDDPLPHALLQLCSYWGYGKLNSTVNLQLILQSGIIYKQKLASESFHTIMYTVPSSIHIYMYCTCKYQICLSIHWILFCATKQSKITEG